MNNRLLSLIFVCVYLLSVAARATNLVVNGSFEGATYVQSETGNILPTDWYLSPPDPITLSKMNVDSASDASVALGPQEGSHYIRFQSSATNGSQDCFYQYINTIAGQQYTISFWVAMTSTSVGNYHYGLVPVWDEYTGNDTILGREEFYYFPTNTGPIAYRFFSFIGTAATARTRLGFHAVDLNGSILLDNVVVEPVSAGPVAPSLSFVGFPNNQFSFRLTGTAGSNYIVQAITNISAPSWISLRTNSAPFTYIETNADLFHQRFYRGVVAP